MLSVNLTTALEKNREISVAIGIFMERLQLSETDAFETLRAFARSERRKLAQVAQELVRATDRRNELIENIRLAGEKMIRNRTGRRKRIMSGRAEKEPEN